MSARVIVVVATHNGLIFIKKASGRAKIDLLVALSNVANEAQWAVEPAHEQSLPVDPNYYKVQRKVSLRGLL